MIESEGGKAIVSLHTTDPMCIPFTPPTVTAHPTWDGSFALRSRSGHFGFAVLEAGGLPFVWETPSGRFSVVCVLLVWVLFLRVQVWQFLLRWDPLFARLILLPRTLQPLLVIHTPPGLFYQVIRRWEKKKKTFPKTGFIKGGGVPGGPLCACYRSDPGIISTQAHLREGRLRSYSVLSNSQFLKKCHIRRLGSGKNLAPRGTRLR